MKALIIDDDLALADVVSFALRRAGFEVIKAYDGQAALDRWEADSPDLIILDLNLPKLDGLSVCRRIRALSDTPIIMLTVRGDEDDIVEGLKLGADDYMVKPFSPRQLVARAEAVLRRFGNLPTSAGPLTAGDLTLDTSRCTVFRAGELVAKLTRLECRLLEILLLNRGQVLSTDGLIDHIWGPSGGDRDMLKQLVYRLRRKIEDSPSNPAYIETIPGVGYSLAV
ncbi:MAG TPA: response regulator transcription factor [Anaerolineales bacterium]|jgi:DNA-binding response OmpR family regulator|nr:response regulator transcription factor [Anaerolineales bacterium]